MLESISNFLTLNNMLMMNIGVAVGILIGAAPGLSVSFAVTILLTMTFHMDSLAAMFLLLGAYCGGMFGGSITATLINTPGTANAVCTAIEGYPLSRRGRAGDALKCALVGSTLGGLVSCVVLSFLAPLIANLIVNVSSTEYFALCCFGIFASIGLEGTDLNKLFKGFISAAFGLLLGCVGADPLFGTNRFSFGSYYMLSGIKMISALLGSYALAQVFINCKSIVRHGDEKLKIMDVGKASMSLRDILRHWKLILKSALIGVFVGAVPGTGGAEGAMFAYNEAKRASKHPEEFGNGYVEGILAAETANNAVTGGAMIPMLTLGIPGDGVMAILLGALTMQGITPGPKLFTSGNSWVYAIMGGLFLINIFMYVQGTLFLKPFAQVARIPQSLMVPCIIVMCVLGAFAIGNNIFEVFVVIAFGLIGYVFKKYGFPVTPMCISLVLGSLFETSLRRALLLSRGDALVFFKRPVSCIIIVLAVVMLLYPIVRGAIMEKRSNARKENAR